MGHGIGWGRAGEKEDWGRDGRSAHGWPEAKEKTEEAVDTGGTPVPREEVEEKRSEERGAVGGAAGEGGEGGDGVMDAHVCGVDGLVVTDEEHAASAAGEVCLPP